VTRRAPEASWTTFIRLHALVLEPAGAAGLAALIEHRTRFRVPRAAVILSGGNITPEQMRDWLLS